VNVLKSYLRISIETLLARGATQREIERFTGVDRKTIRRYQRLAANSPGVATGSEAPAGQIPPPRPPALAGAPAVATPRVTPSACEAHRAWIEAQVGLGRNAVSIYQDLVETHGFGHAYNSVKRFVASLKARAHERFDVLEFLPGEEAQVDYEQGALTLVRPGKYRRPYQFTAPTERPSPLLRFCANRIVTGDQRPVTMRTMPQPSRTYRYLAQVTSLPIQVTGSLARRTWIVPLAQPSPISRRPCRIGHRRVRAVNRAWTVVPRVVRSAWDGSAGSREPNRYAAVTSAIAPAGSSPESSRVVGRYGGREAIRNFRWLCQPG